MLVRFSADDGWGKVEKFCTLASVYAEAMLAEFHA
jgi:hypothetical protein